MIDNKQRYIELRKTLLKDYHISNYIVTVVRSMGRNQKFFMGEYPFCEQPYAVWEGQHFLDFRYAKFFETMTEALEDLDKRMEVPRKRYLQKTTRTLEENDRLNIQIISSEDPYE
ncbi:hypothetical protein [Scatolibacter rhodanostii]|uniref:hypothetical protein n=1 Tax=Scatolibacter rhodanostii TaxID=2014781 RepID=UPI000C082C4B|nr:hypothetical protein [Scatolibacter rhodanostii]